jgi:hypothetical protein
LWEARNGARNNHTELLPQQVINKILAYLEMIFTYLFKEKVAKNKVISREAPRWSPPPVGNVCINVNTVLFP